MSSVMPQSFKNVKLIIGFGGGENRCRISLTRTIGIILLSVMRVFRDMIRR